MNEHRPPLQVPDATGVSNPASVIGAARPKDSAGACFDARAMAHLWVEDDTADGAWTVFPLVAGAAVIDPWLRLECATTPEGTHWVLFGAPRVCVNGNPLAAGIVALRDRDEVLVGTRRYFFSTETLAVVEAYAGGDQRAFCPRCKLQIVAGTPIVRCPGCGVRHHESETSPCWTYAEHCTMCDSPTALDAGFRWTPEAL